MLEFLAFPFVITALALIPSGQMSDKRKIMKIMELQECGVKKEDDIRLPTFLKKLPIEENEVLMGYRYIYRLPIGMSSDQIIGLEQVFSDGLNKPVRVEYKKILGEKKRICLSVYDKELPDLLEYRYIPMLNDEWVIPLGQTQEGMIWHNTDQIPHMTVAGTTRFGKTVFLKMMLTYLIENHSDEFEAYIIDLKGGLEFSRYSSLKQVKKVAGNEIEAYAMLIEIHESMMKMFAYFKKKQWSNIVNTPIKKRKFIIVDEAAQLSPESWMDKDHKKLLSHCQRLLSEISRLGGALGFRLVYCTQYPVADTLPRQIKMNSDAKLTFRLSTGYASQVAIDEKGAEKLPTTIKGRALFKTHEVSEIQVPFISDDEMYSRLNIFQEPVIWEGENGNVINYEENASSRGNSQHSTNIGVRKSFTITNNTQLKK
jgi:DNA segregation ATPase FtsK/SpoIIIE, S-DNA-T family